MDRQELYDQIAVRKSKPQDFQPYLGGNGRVDRCAQLFRNGTLKTGDVLLDVGGAIGDLGYAVKDLFRRRIILDISQTMVAAARAKGNEVVQADVDREGLNHIADSEVDVVTALDFIEHIIDPEKFARECFRTLKHGGQVFLNTPNIQYWEHIESLINGRFPHTSGDREVYHGGHLAFFTFADLCEIFEAVGFVNPRQLPDENFKNPPVRILNFIPAPKNQREFVETMKLFGNPNLLFVCEKP